MELYFNLIVFIKMDEPTTIDMSLVDIRYQTSYELNFGIMLYMDVKSLVLYAYEPGQAPVRQQIYQSKHFWYSRCQLDFKVTLDFRNYDWRRIYFHLSSVKDYDPSGYISDLRRFRDLTIDPTSISDDVIRFYLASGKRDYEEFDLGLLTTYSVLKLLMTDPIIHKMLSVELLYNALENSNNGLVRIILENLDVAFDLEISYEIITYALISNIDELTANLIVNDERIIVDSSEIARFIIEAQITLVVANVLLESPKFDLSVDDRAVPKKWDINENISSLQAMLRNRGSSIETDVVLLTHSQVFQEVAHDSLIELILESPRLNELYQHDFEKLLDMISPTIDRNERIVELLIKEAIARKIYRFKELIITYKYQLYEFYTLIDVYPITQNELDQLVGMTTFSSSPKMFQKVLQLGGSPYKAISIGIDLAFLKVLLMIPDFNPSWNYNSLLMELIASEANESLELLLADPRLVITPEDQKLLPPADSKILEVLARDQRFDLSLCNYALYHRYAASSNYNPNVVPLDEKIDPYVVVALKEWNDISEDSFTLDETSEYIVPWLNCQGLTFIKPHIKKHARGPDRS
ncbi:Hypothetical protein POVR1_LOCUS350 [uncultured virus]|nr:Hypothetical protein POVR1_LOCUS350 [uncultured virus]